MCYLGFSVLPSHQKQEPQDPEEIPNIISQKQSTFLGSASKKFAQKVILLYIFTGVRLKRMLIRGTWRSAICILIPWAVIAEKNFPCVYLFGNVILSVLLFADMMNHQYFAWNDIMELGLLHHHPQPAWCRGFQTGKHYLSCWTQFYIDGKFTSSHLKNTKY